jgi:hypothetical protein
VAGDLLRQCRIGIAGEHHEVRSGRGYLHERTC